MKFKVFDIIQSMENVWNMEWKNFSMERKILNYRIEWKILIDMENGKFSFHSIACPGG